MPRSQPPTPPPLGAPPVISVEERADKLGSLRAGRLASRLPIPTSAVGIIIPHTHTLGVTSRPRGLPCRSGKRQEAQASFLVIIGRLVVQVVQPTRAARGPHHAPSHPACPGPLVRPSASMPGCRLCPGGRGGGCSLGVGGWCWEVFSPCGGLQSHGRRPVAPVRPPSWGGPRPGDPVPPVHPES